MSDLISIIVPVYNISEYIEECIESILKQTYDNLEIIIINDGSTDGSHEICQRLMDKDNRIVYVKQDNMGSVGARRTGLSIAKGCYVIFVDGDDFAEPELVEQMHHHIKSLGVDFVHCNCLENGVNNGFVKESKIYSQNEKDKIAELIRKNIFGVDLDISTENFIEPSIHAKICTIDLARGCFYKVPLSQQYGEDFLFLLHIVMTCNSFAVVPDAYYNYRIRSGSLSHKDNLIDTVIDELSLFNEIKKILVSYEEMSSIIDEVSRKYCGLSLDLFGKAFSNCTSERVEYFYSEEEDILKRKIVIYGAGSVGKDYKRQFSSAPEMNLVCWIDKNCGYDVEGLGKVCDINCLFEMDYDLIIIAVYKKSVAEEIRRELLGYGIPDEKILWRRPSVKHLFVVK